MPILVYKLLLTPLLVGLVTYATRRWGPVIGGCLISLPISGGPITLFITIEQGLAFGGGVAAANVLGMAAVAVFCFVYIQSARFGVIAAALASILAFLLSVFLLSRTGLGIFPAVVLAGALLSLASLSGYGKGESRAYIAPWWDIPLRILAATGLLLTITALAHYLGPTFSGLLGVFPVFTLVIAVFTHQEYGAGPAGKLMHGIALGCYCSLVFYAALALTLPRLGLVWSFLSASAGCIAVNLIIMKFAGGREKAQS